jgi:hypothetical protein
MRLCAHAAVQSAVKKKEKKSLQVPELWRIVHETAAATNADESL